MEVYIIDYNKHIAQADEYKATAEDYERDGEYLEAKNNYQLAAREYARAAEVAWGAGDKVKNNVAESYSDLCNRQALEMIYLQVDASRQNSAEC